MNEKYIHFLNRPIGAIPVAFRVGPWPKAKPQQETRKSTRCLRQRRCNPPRLTTKVANPPIKKGRREHDRAA